MVLHKIVKEFPAVRSCGTRNVCFLVTIVLSYQQCCDTLICPHSVGNSYKYLKQSVDPENTFCASLNTAEEFL